MRGTAESLDTVDVQLVRFEQEPNNAKILDNIFRLVHTIKGTCRFLGLGRLEKVAHAAENVLGNLRDGDFSATPAIVSEILAALDRIKAGTYGICERCDGDIPYKRLKARPVTTLCIECKTAQEQEERARR